MATGTERSKTLRNFTTPVDRRWGIRRLYCSMKNDSDDRISPIRRSADSSCFSDHSHGGAAGGETDFTQPLRIGKDKGRKRKERDSSSESSYRSPKISAKSPAPPPATTTTTLVRRRFNYDGGISATREKLLLEFQTTVDEILKNSIYKKEEIPPPPQPPTSPPVAASVDGGDAYRPWNLRIRRAVCKIPEKSSGGGGGGAAATAGGEKRGKARATARVKLSIPLSKTEIEEDIWKLTGQKPSRRPKKRAKNVQKQLNALFPGLLLTEVTPDMYQVNEDAL
ncbi:uncharacterized protein LOC127261759 [Andrographis paniculata]|uniref:uncharacterized protein LOC127261759 n=1 Tax=Andrographis paniculata TaxID=175694 RepID=UPI0021E84F84|nr:uncharacterized protein LOC127261759 [Andrographis paniculata]XP_051146086.1 uncharacterized protein LOC127261759 [Andrographis paniculata]XP_051146087.1 uncharacterized protein LOC127261759 [Andrographis paniculata]